MFNRRRFLLNVNRFVFLFEVFISIALVLGILVSLPDLAKYYTEIIRSDAAISMQVFNQFLSHVLVLVIAVEFVLMLIAQSDTTIVHLITLVIARKMLITTENLTEILIGVIAIAILFAVRKFLVEPNQTTELLLDDETNLYSAAIQIETLNKRYNFQIDSHGADTLGGLISALADEQGKAIVDGLTLDDGQYIYVIKKVTNELIEEVSIFDLK